MEENLELPIAPTNQIENPLLQLLSELKDEKDKIHHLDLSAIDTFKSEVYTASTLKRLSRLPDIDRKFRECFCMLEDIVCSIDDRSRFNVVLKSVTSNFEADILAAFISKVRHSDDN